MKPNSSLPRIEHNSLGVVSRASTTKWWIGFLVGVTIMNGGLTFWRLGFSPAPVTKESPSGGPPPRPVETVTLQQGTSLNSLRLLGQVESVQQSVVRAQTGGVVKTIMVKVGDSVATRQLMAVLDDRDQSFNLDELQARLTQETTNLIRLEQGTRPEVITQRRAAVISAIAREQEARDSWQRTSELVKEGALSQQLLIGARSNLDNLRGQRLGAEASLAEAESGPTPMEIQVQHGKVKAARAAFNQAKLIVERTRIIATTAGVVHTRFVSQGDLVQPNSPMFTLVAADKLDIFLDIPEEMSTQLKPGIPILLTARALPNWQSRTQITAILPIADPISRRQRVRVELNPVPDGLIAGMAVTGMVTLAGDRPNFVVSRDALTFRNGQWFVFTIMNGKANQIPVELIADMDEQMAIYQSGLKEGQAVVLRGGDGLRDGMPVKEVQALKTIPNQN
ncbi:MAG: efflux RND transporter periplasmic adaptor subunit [Cyanobacteria bacterium LVE1205-1]